jgi:DNA-binding transcriptional ArsR family regulator
MTTSDDEPGRMTRLEQQMQEISDRLAALERAIGQSMPPPAPSPMPPAPAAGPIPASVPGPVPGPVPPGTWIGAPAPGEGPGGEQASFYYSGQGWFGRNRMMIQQRARLSDVLDAEPEPVAKVFAALSSPARIVLLRALLDGPRTSQQLRAELDDPSVGQLYHHLRELLAAGLIIQPGRSLYAIPRGAEITLCIEIVAALHMSAVSRPYPGAPPGQLDDQEPDPTDDQP